MKHVVVFFLLVLSLAGVQAQDSAVVKKAKKDWSKVSLANIPKDHFLLQFGYGPWTQKPDSIHTKGMPFTFNAYIMFAFPFKLNPRISVAIGAGVGSDQQYFSKTYVDVSSQHSKKLTFTDVSDTNHFKKTKLTTTYLEAPIELRFTSNPERPINSWKGALGLKVGYLVSAGTRNKELQNSKGTTINDYTLKEKSKRYFNTTRFCATARIGYGIVSLFGSYQLNTFIREGLGPSDIRPLQLGITISGL
jgi:hypothetical protein